MHGTMGLKYVIHICITFMAIAAYRCCVWTCTSFHLLKPTGHVMHQQLHALPTLYLCVLYLSENKQRLVPLTG